MLTKEAQVVLRGAKLNLTEDDCEFIIKSFSEGLDYAKFLYYSIHNRVVPLVWKNIEKLNIDTCIERGVRRTMKSICNDISIHSSTIYPEICKISKEFYNADIKAILLKGIALGISIYKDISLREFRDVDYLINIEDAPKVTEILADMGYIQGKYDKKLRTIIPATKNEKIFRRMYTHELVEFVKSRDNYNNPVFIIDINHEILWSGDNKKNKKHIHNLKSFFENSELIESNDLKAYTLGPEFQLLQLCAHIYSEAVYFCWEEVWPRNRSEVCLYRFCDIYELINSLEIDWVKFEQIVRENGIEAPVFYALTTVGKLFGCYVPESFLKSLDIRENIIDLFYDKDGNAHYWKVDLYERLFNIEKKYQEICNAKVY